MENVEGELELVNHYFTTIMVKIGLGKNHQRMLNLGGNFEKEHNIYMVFHTAYQLQRRKKQQYLYSEVLNSL